MIVRVMLTYSRQIGINGEESAPFHIRQLDLPLPLLPRGTVKNRR